MRQRAGYAAGGWVTGLGHKDSKLGGRLEPPVSTSLGHAWAWCGASEHPAGNPQECGQDGSRQRRLVSEEGGPSAVTADGQALLGGGPGPTPFHASCSAGHSTARGVTGRRGSVARAVAGSGFEQRPGSEARRPLTDTGAPGLQGEASRDTGPRLNSHIRWTTPSLCLLRQGES